MKCSTPRLFESVKTTDLIYLGYINDENTESLFDGKWGDMIVFFKIYFRKIHLILHLIY